MPERTCFACKQKATSASLLRFVCKDGCIVWDKHRCLPGRGAYLHASGQCIGYVLQIERWAHVFRLKRETIKSQGLANMELEICAHVGINKAECIRHSKKKKILI